MDTLITGACDSRESDSDSTIISNYGDAGAIFQGKKNWLNWKPANDDQQMNYRPTNTKNKDENAVNGLLETVQRMTGKNMERRQRQQQPSYQPSFANDLNPAASWTLREDAKQMTWGEVLQPENAPVSSVLQTPPAPAQRDPTVQEGMQDFQNEQAIRQKARTESWGDMMRQASPMHHNDRHTMSALQQAQTPYAEYMSDLGVASSDTHTSALQESVGVSTASQEKTIESEYLKDLDAPISFGGSAVAAPQESVPTASSSSSYMNDLQ
jgi:hypothetical protein